VQPGGRRAGGQPGQGRTHAGQAGWLGRGRAGRQAGAIEPGWQVEARGFGGREQRLGEAGGEAVGVHALKREPGEVLRNKGVEAGAAHQVLQRQQQQAAFLIRNVVEAVVGVAARQAQAQVSGRASRPQLLHGVAQVSFAQYLQHIGVGPAIELLHNAALKINRETFIQPEIISGCICNQVAAPGVGQLVRYQAGQAAVARQNNRCYKC